MSNFEDILPSLYRPKKFPSPLPLIHVSKSGKSGFERIINDLNLSPSHCEVFQEHLLYFSYGNVFYDTGNEPTRDQTQFPICFLFEPKALSKIDYYFPYDTGAAHHNKYGKHSQHLKDNFDRYKINNPRNEKIYPSLKLVYYIYGNNRNYRSGKIKPKIQKKIHESLPELLQFLKDANIQECDERQYTIECQTTKRINLHEYLSWIAFPESYFDLFIQLRSAMQFSPPIPYQYEPGMIYHPLKIIGEIRAAAQEYIEKKYL